VNPIDIRDLALNLDGLLTADGPGRPRFPLLVTSDGDPIAVIIRHKAYAPRLDDFYVADTGDGDDRVNLVCSLCAADQAVVTTWRSIDDRGLGSITKTANEHWRDTHQQRK
jgi:hypothetical protein